MKEKYAYFIQINSFIHNTPSRWLSFEYLRKSRTTWNNIKSKYKFSSGTHILEAIFMQQFPIRGIGLIKIIAGCMFDSQFSFGGYEIVLNLMSHYQDENGKIEEDYHHCFCWNDFLNQNDENTEQYQPHLPFFVILQQKC